MNKNTNNKTNENIENKKSNETIKDNETTKSNEISKNKDTTKDNETTKDKETIKIKETTKNKKTTKNKTNFFSIIRMVQSTQPKFLPVTIMEQVIASFIPFVNIVLGAKIIDEMVDYIGRNGEKKEASIIKIAILMVNINMVLALVRWALNKVLIVYKRKIDDTISLKVIHKSLTMDYQVLEKTETLDYITKAREGSNSNGGITMYCSILGDFISSVVKIVYSIIILSGFFTSKISIVEQTFLNQFINSYWCGIVMFICILLTIFYNITIFKKINKLQYQFFEDNVRGNRQYGYFFSFIYEYSSGKSVRIYDVKDFILKKMNERGNHLSKEELTLARKSALLSGQGEFISAIFLFVSYIFVGMKTVIGAISIGVMTMYVGALTTFTQSFINMCWQYAQYSVQSKYLRNYVEFLTINNEKCNGTLSIEKSNNHEYELEFRNVSFHYPNSDEMILKNVSAKIKVGKKMAIVGKNGSGKSTFIKLLCRLYDPTEGQILLDGIDIKNYDYEKYRDVFGVVFQDFQLFSFSIAQNVAAGVDYVSEKVWKCLEQAGLKERVEAMEKGIDTVIYKLGDEGVEISGGEAQKLAIARALYKDAPVVILDEPTAALDPVSELEIYEKFDEMVNDKTAIYISHRMSSCRFCDNIVVFDQGEIIQMGSHESLANTDGRYKELWEAQSQYYK